MSLGVEKELDVEIDITKELVEVKEVIAKELVKVEDVEEVGEVIEVKAAEIPKALNPVAEVPELLSFKY